MITNILFADDSLLFGQASKREPESFMSIIQKYVAALGQRINFHKVSDGQKGDILDILQTREMSKYDKYLLIVWSR